MPTTKTSTNKKTTSKAKPIKKKIISIKKKKDDVKLSYYSPEQIRQQLWDHGWINNTLSPVSTEPYWEITNNIIPTDEECISGFFAQSYAGAMIHKMFTFICTKKCVYSIMEVSGVVTYKVFMYEDFSEINLYQDEYLASLIYIDIYLTKFRFFRLETSDPTSVLNFKKTVIEQQLASGTHKTLDDIADRTLAQRAGMSIWRFIWRKFRFLINMRTDRKVKHEMKVKAKAAAKAEKLAKQNASDPTKKVEQPTTHVESL